MPNCLNTMIASMRAEGYSDADITALFHAEMNQQAVAGRTSLKGSELRIGSFVRTWFAPNGTHVLDCKPYTGPLKELAGARILTFASRTPSGRTPMTVGPDDWFEVAPTRSVA
jgi:hypothetical protein